MSARAAAVGAVAWAALIFWASHQQRPFPMLPSGLLSHDKLIHAGVFGVLAFFVRRALEPRALPPLRAWLLAWAIALGWGVLDELHQSFIPNRMCELNDAIADGAGAALGALLAGGGLRRARSGASIRA